MRILSRIKIKLLAFCLLITLVLFSFTGCKDHYGSTRFKKYAPTNFPNSVWATENGEITFRVAESETMRYKGTVLNRYGDPVYSYEYASAFGEVNKGEVKYDVFIGWFTNTLRYNITEIDSNCIEPYYYKLYICLFI